MKRFKNTGSLFVNIVVYLYILLFVYAAVSKLLEFRDFQTQLGQSPILGAYAEVISYGVIISELLCAVLLLIERYKKAGLYFAFVLMAMFTAYIIIILNFSSYTPCSCGGVLESMGWTEHLVFNTVFLLMAVVALVLEHPIAIKKTIIILLGLLITALGIMTVLFFLSDQEIKRNNGFQRKYIPHALENLGSYQLESNAFYLAGADGKNFYLGNYNAPLYLKAISKDLKTANEVRIEIDNYNLPFKRVRIKVQPSLFFVGDGTVPILFRGKTKDWKAQTFSYKDAYFNQFEVVDTSHLVIGTHHPRKKYNLIGALTKYNDRITSEVSDEILHFQADGTFDTDGILLWNEENRQILYVYYYRNQFEVAGQDLNYIYTGKTIDTLSKAKLNVAYHQKNDTYQLGKAVMVNRLATVWGNRLYIVSDRLGKFENDKAIQSAGIIDQYDLSQKEYVRSFYFYHQRNEKIREISVFNDTMVALVNDQLWLKKMK